MDGRRGSSHRQHDWRTSTDWIPATVLIGRDHSLSDMDRDEDSPWDAYASHILLWIHPHVSRAPFSGGKAKR